MIKFKGQVLFVEDARRTLPVKDKNGIPTQMTKEHRFTRIQMLVKDPLHNNVQRAVLVQSIDAPATFVLPEQGKEWETPEINYFDSRKGSPEASFSLN